jgi:hypothetical protein
MKTSRIKRSSFLAAWALPMLASSVLGEDLGDRDISRTYPDPDSFWCPSIEAPRDPAMILSFEADGPVATITFTALNEGSGEWLAQRIDNVAVVEAEAFTAPPNQPACVSPEGNNLCCNQADDSSYESRFFDPSSVDPARIIFRDDFAEGPDPRWRGIGDESSSPVYWMPDSSAPEPPIENPGGGSLALGRASDGPIQVRTSFTLTNLVAERVYVVAGWWHVGVHNSAVGLLNVSVASPYAFDAVGEPLRFNQVLPGDQEAPDVASSSSGDSVVVWETPGEGCRGLRGRRFQRDALLGGELPIWDPAGCDGGPNVSVPSVGFGPGGAAFAVAWTEEPGLAIAPDHRAMFRRFSYDSGLPSADAVTVEETLDTIKSTSVAFDRTSDRIAVVWQEELAGVQVGFDVLFAKIFRGDGTQLLDKTELVEDGLGTALWNGDSLAAAWSYGEPFFAEPFRISYQLFTDQGVSATPVRIVSDAGVPEDVSLAVSETTGDFLIAWTADDPSGRAVFAVLVDPVGEPLTGVIRVSDTHGFHGHPDVASDGESFAVAWEEDLDPSKVRVRRLDAAGAPDGQSILVESSARRAQLHPAISGGPAGSYLLVWEGTRDDVDETPSRDILGRRLVRIDELDPATPVQDLADGSQGNMRYFRFVVPEGVQELRVDASGGMGDADLYARSMVPPTLADFHSSASSAGNEESLTVASPAPSEWFLGVHTAGPYAGLDLQLILTPSSAGGCQSSATTMCLNENRFQVEVDWIDFEGRRGEGTVVEFGAEDSGLFWFFDRDNWEMLVKVLDGCGTNGHYWVFSAATTNVGYSLRVTDTSTGLSVDFENSLGTSSPAVTAIEALASCP